MGTSILDDLQIHQVKTRCLFNQCLFTSLFVFRRCIQCVINSLSNFQLCRKLALLDRDLEYIIQPHFYYKNIGNCDGFIQSKAVCKQLICQHHFHSSIAVDSLYSFFLFAFCVLLFICCCGFFVFQRQIVVDNTISTEFNTRKGTPAFTSNNCHQPLSLYFDLWINRAWSAFNTVMCVSKVPYRRETQPSEFKKQLYHICAYYMEHITDMMLTYCSDTPISI